VILLFHEMLDDAMIVLLLYRDFMITLSYRPALYICYPDAFSFTSKQTSWGCKHEKVAKEMYMKKKLETRDSGLCINQQRPFIGAYPDCIVSCQCVDNLP